MSNFQKIKRESKPTNLYSLWPMTDDHFVNLFFIKLILFILYRKKDKQTHITMDLKQTKLTKTEWENTEIPVGDDEKRILKLICDGFHDVSIKTNMNQSLYQLIKVNNSSEMEAYLYERYFSKEVNKLMKKYGSETIGEFNPVTKSTNTLKKTDIIKIDNMDNFHHIYFLIQ